MDAYLNAQEETRLSKLFEEKKRLLGQRGHFTHRQLEDAFHQRQSGLYLRDVIFGANDGIVTTFAVIAGAAGAGLSNSVIIILGVANLIADGLSMGLGNYLGERSDEAYNRGQREKELWEVERFHEIERAEVKGILRQRYGFRGQLLEDTLNHIAAEPKRFVDFMMREELDIIENEGGTGPGPAKHGFAMFLAFVVAGAIPLLPFLVSLPSGTFGIALALAGIAFFTIGSLRSKLTPVSWWKAGLEVFLIGALASAASYGVGALLEGIVK